MSTFSHLLGIYLHFLWRSSKFYNREEEASLFSYTLSTVLPEWTGRALHSFNSVAQSLHSLRCWIVEFGHFISWLALSVFVFQVITGALQCLIWILRFPLPSTETKAEQLMKHLFLLLKDYAKLGAARGQNFHLVVNCFKVRCFHLHLEKARTGINIRVTFPHHPLWSWSNFFQINLLRPECWCPVWKSIAVVSSPYHSTVCWFVGCPGC